LTQLNWFSPLPPERSDIAHYTARLAPALVHRFETLFWTTKKDAQSLPRGAKIKIYDPEWLGDYGFLCELQRGLNIYNFGNDVRFHEAIYRIAKRVPGVAILHDTRLHHFVFESDRPNWRKYIELAAELYGAKGEKAARQIADSQGALIDKHVEAMPFIEPFLSNAIGAICHSESAAADIKRHSSVPLLQLPLPFASLARTPGIKRNWSQPFRLIMFGYMGSNRRLKSILAALKDISSEIVFHLDLYGTLHDESEIEKLIDTLGLGSRVTLHGFVSEQALDDAIASAHLAFNLRHPTMGEASGGILRSWFHATPAIVTNAGWYAGLPDKIIRKISIEDEHAELLQALRDLASNPASYERLGVEAAAYVRDNHSPESYAGKLGNALSDVPELFWRFAARRTLEGVARNAKSADERALLLERASPQTLSLFFS